jgi:benzoyl-CoA reductase/2-hydroxyglutaryl-CoA dehydratase subunit BcrC/BadD/HgdB
MDVLELLSDYANYLREQKEQGKKIIAFMGHDNMPEELLDAAGFIPLRMMFAGNDDLMNASNDFLPPSTCSFAQSCIGLFSLKPSQYNFLNLVDQFIVSNHCVSDTCTSEIITKYFNIPRLNFYVSYTQDAEGLKYFKLELLDLKQHLEELIGTEIRKEDIVKSIKKYNTFKKKLAEINHMKIRSSDKLGIFQKAILYGPIILPELEEFIQANKTNQTHESKDSVDIFLTGCSIFIGDYLMELIEESGGNIQYFDTWIGDAYFSQVFNEEEIASHDDPLDFFVERFKNNKNGDHTVPYYFENKIKQIKEIIKEHKEKGRKIGVINHVIKFCDHINIFQSFLKKELQEDGIQVLNLERDYSRANRGQLSTRVEAFMEMM